VGAVEEFDVAEREIVVGCYPIETVTKFEVKASEGEGWVEQTGVEYLVRRGCVISLGAPLSLVPGLGWGVPLVGRVTYTGGYVLPGSVADAGQAALPADVGSACVEQAAAWFLQRDRVGLERYWPKDGVFLSLSQLPLLPQVSAMLRPHRRWAI
jgi:hypothetical protein